MRTVALPGARSVHAVSPNHLQIECDIETGARRNLHPAVLYLRPVRPHRLPDRIAIGIRETLGVGTVHHGRKELLRNLRFLVMTHMHACACAERGDAAPVGNAAAFRDVVIYEVYRARVEKPADGVARDLRLARG